MFELWKTGGLNLAELLATVYKALDLDEVAYVFLVLFARAIKEAPTGWTLSEITDLMAVPSDVSSSIFMQLIRDGFILIDSQSDETGKRHETYCLSPLFLRIENVLKKRKYDNLSQDLTSLFSRIEQIFGVLSPKDIETVHMWLGDDGFSPELIELALSEMQLYDIKSIKYVDKILLDWKRKNVYTVDEAKRSMTAFRNKKPLFDNKDSEQSLNPDDYYNWIEAIKKGSS